MISTKTVSRKNKQNLVLPLNYSNDLAEETGIHIGDGFMNIYKKDYASRYVYSGHATDDFEFSLYVKVLMKRLYNLNPSRENIQKNTIMLHYSRKGLIEFKYKLGLPLGVKNNIKIPQWIMENRKFKIACVKGIFATDGSLLFQKKYRTVNYYPQLKISSKSKELINQIYAIFNELNIKSSVCCDKEISIRHPNIIWLCFIYGRENLQKFVETIGFSNPKHLRKYNNWKNNAGGDTSKSRGFVVSL